MPSSATLPYPFTPLRRIEVNELRWIVCFYTPKHSDGDRKRLYRLEAQARLVRAIAASVAVRLDQSKHEYFRLKEAKVRILKSTTKLGTCLNHPDETCFQRIAHMFVQKRHLLNVILFVHANEPEVTRPRWHALKLVEDLIEDDTTDWMEILDYVQTIKKPNYLKGN